MMADLLKPIGSPGPSHRMEFGLPEVPTLQKLESNNSWRTGQGRYRGRAGAVAMAGCFLLLLIQSALTSRRRRRSSNDSAIKWTFSNIASGGLGSP